MSKILTLKMLVGRANDVQGISPPRGFWWRWPSGWCLWSWKHNSRSLSGGKESGTGSEKWLPQCIVQTCIVILAICTLVCSWDCLCWWSGLLTNKGCDFFMYLLCLAFHGCQLSETGLWTLAVIQLNGQTCLQRGKGEKGLRLYRTGGITTLDS